MASADALITRDGPVAAPFDYQVPAGSEIAPVCVTASFDGSAAGVAFVPTLEVLAPDGRVVTRCPLATSIAAGGSADVSWFPWRRGIAAAAHAAVPNSTYQTAVLALGPVGYWPMDDPAGTLIWTDLSGNSLNTSGNGSALWLCQVAGLIPTSADTATQPRGGTTNKNSQTPAFNFAYAALSVACWVNTTFNNAAVSHMLMANTGSAGTAQVFQFRIVSGVPQFIMLDTAGGTHQVNGPGSIADGKSHMLVGVWTGTQLIMYVDAVAGLPVAAVFAQHQGLAAFGISNPINFVSGQALTGTLDEVACFQSALTAAQISKLYLAATTT